jgi:hypothetical protein
VHIRAPQEGAELCEDAACQAIEDALEVSPGW